MCSLSASLFKRVTSPWSLNYSSFLRHAQACDLEDPLCWNNRYGHLGTNPGPLWATPAEDAALAQEAAERAQAGQGAGTAQTTHSAPALVPCNPSTSSSVQGNPHVSPIVQGDQQTTNAAPVRRTGSIRRRGSTTTPLSPSRRASVRGGRRTQEARASIGDTLAGVAKQARRSTGSGSTTRNTTGSGEAPSPYGAPQARSWTLNEVLNLPDAPQASSSQQVGAYVGPPEDRGTQQD